MSAPDPDHIYGAVASILFSLSLGILSVAVPLLAVKAGYGTVSVGALVALAAVAQLAARLLTGVLMERFPDKVLIYGSALLIAGSCVLIAWWTSLAVFVASQLLQGVARAFFWTGSQTHAVRVSGSAVRGLTVINMAAGAGALTGPALAGVLGERSFQLALIVGAVAGAAAVVPAWMLRELRPFARVSKGERGRRRMWTKPGVDAACWMSAVAGGWRGMLSSYVPVVLSQAGQTSSTLGLLVSVTNIAAMLGSGVSALVRRLPVKALFVVSALAAGAGMAGLGLAAASAVAAAAALAVSGLGAGVLQTVGPAVGSEAVDPDRKGDAIASAGMFRALALLAVPGGMAALVAMLPLTTAFLLVGAAMTLPSLVWRSKER